jgi:hypothetical protein
MEKTVIQATDIKGGNVFMFSKPETMMTPPVGRSFFTDDVDDENTCTEQLEISSTARICENVTKVN